GPPPCPAPPPPLLPLSARQQGGFGNKLRLLVYTPFQQGRLLFTLEGQTVVDYHTVTFTDATEAYHVIEIPLRDRHRPHFYLRGRFVHAESPLPVRQPQRRERTDRERDAEDDGGPRYCRVEVRPAKEVAMEETLAVRMTTDRQQYRPGDAVRVDFRVSERDGKPRAAELSLGAVDESVYTFGEARVEELARLFADPHPAQMFREKAWRHAAGDR